MKKIATRVSQTLRLRLLVLTAAVLGLFVLIPSLASAQPTVASFNIALSSSEQVLAFPDDPMVMHFQSWDSPLERIIERNMPFIEVGNSALSNVPIIEFRMTIGDLDFNFSDAVLGDFAVIGTTTPNVMISSTSGGDELIVQFADGGLAPGEMARFQIDIDPDPGVDSFVYPDYRTVLFDVNGSDDSDNSLATAIFDIPENGTTPVSIRLPDFQQEGPIYLNEHIRPYSVMEDVERFGTTEVIPEPTAMILLALGALGLSVGRRPPRS